MLQFGDDQGIIGIRGLGVNGGVDLSSIFRITPEYDLKNIDGAYFRVPGVSGLLQNYVILSNFTACSGFSSRMDADQS